VPPQEVQGEPPHIAVVIPCYKVKSHILQVLDLIPEFVHTIYVIDDACPEKSGEFVCAHNEDPQVSVIFLNKNCGVGGAVKAGYQAALSSGAEIIIKVDGDGQMDPREIEELIAPILSGDAFYAKGNRFADLSRIHQMPKVRIFGNLALSFLTKLSTGYWRMFDPNNGFTAIHSQALRNIDLMKIDNRYFFESDMLFRLGLLRVNVVDVPMGAKYGDEKSNLRIGRTLFEFAGKHLRNAVKRIIYTYYLRDFTLASIELPLGILGTSLGTGVGLYSWIHGIITHQRSSNGTIGLVSISIILGIQFLLAFLSFDVNNSPWNGSDFQIKSRDLSSPQVRQL